ncbi:hypothetical protein TNCV_2442041 [Trichonephila clavipes]|nr:hypothetical protein TNCV_2442041 [Trichonephila clavipes]
MVIGTGCRPEFMPIRNCRWRERETLRGLKETVRKVTRDISDIIEKAKQASKQWEDQVARELLETPFLRIADITISS